MAEGFGGTILSSPIFIEVILPFLLIFAVAFAVLQKTSILGKDKKQIDAIVALVIGLIFVAFGQAVGFVINLIPIFAVSVVVLLVFMLIYGMAFQPGEFKLPGAVKGVVGALAAIVVVVAVLIFTGWWDYLAELFLFGEDSGLLTNVIFFAVIIAAILIVVLPGGKKKKEEKKEE